MVAATQIREWSGVSRRRVPRFRMQSPLDVTVLRSGIPDTLPGRSIDVCERGIAAMLAGELLPGETVGVEVQLSAALAPLRTRATVRYQDRLKCGLEFVSITAEQRLTIREWAKEAEAVPTAVPAVRVEAKLAQVRRERGSSGTGGTSGKPPRKRRSMAWMVVLAMAIAAGAFLWWRWNRSWEELESGLRGSGLNGPRVQVPAEVMQKLLVHKVEPVYPAAARKDNPRGIIAIDMVIGRDGSVESMRPLNGPDVLARAAMDALRWWRFQPYRVNGQAVTAETTLAVEFKP